MTHQEARMGVGRDPTPPDYTPRLRLKPKAPRTGYVDGGLVAGRIVLLGGSAQHERPARRTPP